MTLHELGQLLTPIGAFLGAYAGQRVAVSKFAELVESHARACRRLAREHGRTITGEFELAPVRRDHQSNGSE